MRGDSYCPKCGGSGIRNDEFGPNCVFRRTELLLAQIQAAQVVAAERVVCDALAAAVERHAG